MTDDFEGREVPPDAIDWIRANPGQTRQILEDIERADSSDAPEAQFPPDLEWAHEGEASFPKPILGCAKRGGAVLSEGETCVLSAAGGTGKSTLAASIALSVAMAEDNLREPVELEGGLFHGFGGKVVYVTYEDPPSVIKWKLRKLAKLWDDNNGGKELATDALRRVGVLSMRGWPLYGPVGDRASYNTVPGQMAGWYHMWKQMDLAKPLLIIIDPALTAFVGEANSATQVMSFLDALSNEAGKRQAGILLLAHSTKSARAATADPFHPGMVSGTGAWTDHVRGVLTMGEYQKPIPGSKRPERHDEEDETETMLVLRVYKANWGPSRITVRLEAETDGDTPVGFSEASPWVYGPDPGSSPSGQDGPGVRTKGATATAGNKAAQEFNDFV